MKRKKHCEDCGKQKGRIEWANKSHKYKRDVKDWISLCKPCHGKYDKRHWGIASKIYDLQNSGKKI